MRGYREEGAATTPFDMTVLNHLDRFSLARSALQIVGPEKFAGAPEAVAWLEAKLDEHRAYVKEHGIDMPEVREWKMG